MNTAQKLIVGIGTICFGAITGVGTWVVIRSDKKYQKRCEEMHEVMMQTYRNDLKASERRLDYISSLLDKAMCDKE